MKTLSQSGLRLLAAVVFVVAPHATAHAQRLTGIVRDTGLTAPLAGAVVSVLDSSRTSLARAITDAEGRYSVELPANATQLRVVRIGFQPRVVALGRPRAASLVLDLYMMRVASLLQTVTINDERICSQSRDRVGALSLWEQARAGLLASVVAREAQPAVAMLLRYERQVDIQTGRVVKQTVALATGRTTRPFIAPDAPRVLAEKGYLHADSTERQFSAPDADVLLDDSFAATHCFTVQPADLAHEGAIGLAFEPARDRDKLIDVRGVLWLDAGTPALRALEYRYTGGSTAFERSGAGGTLHFHTMTNGVVFVDQWVVGLPMIERVRQVILPGARGRTVLQPERATRMAETGGYVLSGTWADELHYESSLKPLAGVVREERTGRPLAGGLVMLEATSDTITADSAGRFELFPVLPGRYVVLTADTTYSKFVAPRWKAGEVLIESGRAVDQNFELPGRAEAVKALCGRDADLNLLSSILVGRIIDITGANTVPGNARVEAAWLREGSTAQMETQTVSVDDAGRFSICGVARERVVHLAARRDRVAYTDTTVMIQRDSAVMAVEWKMNLGALATVVAPKMATLRGRLTRLGPGNAIAGAEVWLPALDRHATSDSSGAFNFDSLPATQTILQVRRVGFAVQRDTVTLAAGVETVRDYAMLSSAQMLDTVRTTAQGTRYASPGIRGFEERRKTQVSGYFISDSALRQQDGKMLSSIIMSRVSGLWMVPGRSGAMYMTSSRKQCAGPVLTICASPNCYVTIYLDGVQLYSTNSGAPPVDATRISVADLAGAEFYPTGGTGPPQYNATDSGCGVLLLWSRER